MCAKNAAVPRVKAVLDTNVLVSALLKNGGREALIFNLAASGMFVPVVSGPLLDEYAAVLGRPGFGFETRRVQGALQDIRRHALHVGIPPATARTARDPDDDMVLACALARSADYVVTGNTRHFPREFHGSRIVPPRQFVVILAAEAG